eukprot:TRINITY_DN44844_c0_g1_i5.p1 TRINITY_DN44844_c0_g1~~TRINITY_DN44844_c0_g1_i5.p1  ORF type:complete len:118 (+),score=7.69 TRINITY_DN44844_c0_g1_i5:190-543(+)
MSYLTETRDLCRSNMTENRDLCRSNMTENRDLCRSNMTKNRDLCRSNMTENRDLMNKNKAPNTVQIVPTLNISLKTATNFRSEYSFFKWLIQNRRQTIMTQFTITTANDVKGYVIID